MSFLVNRERYARRLAKKEAMNAVWIDRKNQAEWSVDDGHHHLQFNAGAAPDTGVRAGKEPNLFRRELTLAVEHLPCQLILLQDPRVSEIKVWRHREYAPDDWDPILDVHDTLSIATHIDHVIKRTRDGSACLRIGDSHTPHDVCNRRDLPEIEAANVEVAAKEESLIVRHSRIIEPINK